MGWRRRCGSRGRTARRQHDRRRASGRPIPARPRRPRSSPPRRWQPSASTPTTRSPSSTGSASASHTHLGAGLDRGVDQRGIETTARPDGAVVREAVGRRPVELADLRAGDHPQPADAVGVAHVDLRAPRARRPRGASGRRRRPCRGRAAPFSNTTTDAPDAGRADGGGRTGRAATDHREVDRPPLAPAPSSPGYTVPGHDPKTTSRADRSRCRMRRRSCDGRGRSVSNSPSSPTTRSAMRSARSSPSSSTRRRSRSRTTASVTSPPTGAVPQRGWSSRKRPPRSSTGGSPRSPSASAMAPSPGSSRSPKRSSPCPMRRSARPTPSATRRPERWQAQPVDRPRAARHRHRRTAQPPPGLDEAGLRVDRTPRRDAGVPDRTQRGPGRVTQSHPRRGHHRCDQRRTATVGAVPVGPARREAEPVVVRRHPVGADRRPARARPHRTAGEPS